MKKTLIISLFIITILIYLGSYLLSFGLYQSINYPKTSFSLGVFQSDSVYGHTLKQDNLGFYYFSTKQTVPIYSNHLKNRTFQDNPCESKLPNLLFIGDSFTFGDGVLAEQTFPFIVQEKMSKCVLNAAKSGYGYAQYLLQLEELATQISKDSCIIFIQLSPWLTDRSINRNMGSFLNMQVPFFRKTANEISVSHPVYKAKLIDLIDTEEMEEKYNNEKFELRNFLELHNAIGKKIYWSNIRDELKHLSKTITLKYPESNEVLPYLFQVLNEKHSGYNIVFVNIGFDPISFQEICALPMAGSFKFVDIEKALHDSLKGAEYFKQYGHWNENELIDRHYNEAAHAIGAEVLINFLQN